MPIFEYICTECKKRFEELVQSSQSSVLCPACGADKSEKQLSLISASNGKSTTSASGGTSCGSGFT